MNSKTVLLVILSLAITVSIHAQQKYETLDNLIELATSVSPKIRLLKSKKNVAGSKIEQGTNLPDPMLTLGLVNMPTNTFSFTQEPMSGKIIGVTQAFPFPGGLSAKADVIAMDTLIVTQEIEDLKNEIRKNVSTLYYDLQFVREEIILTNESKSLLKQISEVVKRKYEVSGASLQNIIQVEVQITREDDRIVALDGKENGIVSELNALLLRDDNSPITTDEIASVGENKFSSKSLIEVANLYRPFLKGIQIAEQKSKLMERSAEYSYYPNFQVGMQYMLREHSSVSGQNWNDFFSVVVGISLPLNYGGKYSAQVEEAQYLQSLYREQYSSSVQTLNQSFGNISSKLNELQIRNKLISGTLLPQAEQAFQASLADYQVGELK
jgi:cobalt-zinc-cadmium efflux system outer membrane protein